MFWEFAVLVAYIAGSYMLVTLGIRWFWRDSLNRKYSPDQKDEDKDSKIN